MRYRYGLFGLLLIGGCQSAPTPEGEKEPAVPEGLPYHEIAFDDLAGFQPVAANWSVAGTVVADHTQKHDLQAKAGTGVLVNRPEEGAKDNLFTAWEHGDLELDLEFMIPKGSNSGIYLQGRYEVQLLDSWLVEDLRHADCGGIYQRWDENRPESERGYEGYAPRMNAAKAPGLWQHLYIDFRAPRFDADGNKIANARFEKVVLNGVTLHEGVEVTGPTRAAAFGEEAALGPLMVQGDHGPVALRRLRYKRYFEEELDLRDLRYRYYEVEGPITQLPDFDTLSAVREGSTDSLVFEKLSERQERVAYIFEGTLKVPKSGDYLFRLYSDDGSHLFIDGEQLIDNDGKHDFEPRSGLIALREGTHDLRLTYFNNNWGKGLMLQYEGPEIRLQPLYSREPAPNARQRPMLLVEPGAAPEMVRSFVMHGGEKLTHAISVGDPSGVHYSVDLRQGALLQVWRGGFADVTDMWHHRGLPQLLHPLPMSVEAGAAPIAARLAGKEDPYPNARPDDLQLLGYDIDEADRPVFRYQVGEALILDHYRPSEDSLELVRSIRAERGSEGVYCLLAAADYIEPVGNGYYSVGGRYYLRLLTPAAEALLRQQGDQIELLYPLTASNEEVNYSILW